MDAAHVAHDVEHLLSRRRRIQPMPLQSLPPHLGPRHGSHGSLVTYPVHIQSEFSLGLSEHGDERFAYGARSEAAAYVGDLLSEEVPALANRDLEIVAIARR